ncbi:SIR2 family protein [Candidatus Pyrohabitans sp.]
MRGVELPPGLVRDIRENKPALFLGAGASICNLISKDRRLPLGDDVKIKLLKYFYDKTSESSVDEKELEERFKREYFPDKEILTPEMIWSEVLESRGEELLPHTRILNDLFNKNKIIPPNYKYIARLLLRDIFSTIITTNFDEKLEKALEKIRQTERVAVDIFYTAASDDDFKYYKEAHHRRDIKMIYKLHGTLSRPHTIKSSSEELGKISREKFEVLEDIFQHYGKIIFIGYSCRDEDIYNAFLELSKKYSRRGKIWWFSLDKTDRINEILIRFKSENNFCKIDSYELLYKLDKYFSFKTSGNVLNNITLKKELPESQFLKDYGSNLSEFEIKFNDPVYGTIVFDFRNVKYLYILINSADIQRLRDIKQLSFLHYYYPGATHSRFEHSIGVAYLVSKALKSLREKTEEIDDIIMLNTIFAAIIHDIGHGPFSHVVEVFAERTGRKHPHENITIEFIRSGLLDIKEIFRHIPIIERYVEEILKYTVKLESFPENIFLSWLIGGYALDFDRIDFLLRDLYHTGAYRHSNMFKNFNLQYLKDRLRIVDILTKSVDIGFHSKYDDAKLLCFDKKIEPLLKNFLDLYVNMYLNVYRTTTDICARAMIVKALQIADNLGDISMEDLYMYTDAELFTFLENVESEIVNQLAWCVKYRKFFKSILVFKPKSGIKEIEIENTLKDNLGIEETKFNDLLIVSVPNEKRIGPLFLKDENGKVEEFDTSIYSKRINTNRKGYIFVPWNSTIRSENLKDILKSELGIIPY